MAVGLFKSLRGEEGYIEAKYIGAPIGTFVSWSLTRRGEAGPAAGLYDLYAVFRYVNTALFEDPDYEKEIVLKLSKSKRLRIVGGQRTELVGKQLRMEGVEIWRLE